jgi:hypothetical protein
MLAQTKNSPMSKPVVFELSRSHLITNPIQNILLSQSSPCWHNQISEMISVEPFVYKIGRCVLHSFTYCIREQKIKQPLFEDVSSSLALIGCDILDETHLWRLSKELIKESAEVLVSLPSKIYHKIQNTFHEAVVKNVTDRRSVAIDIHFEEAPEKALEAPDVLNPIKALLANPAQGYVDYLNLYSHGSPKLITLEHVHRFAKEFFSNIAVYGACAVSAQPLHVLKTSYDSQVVVHNEAGKCSLYPIFERFRWKGSFKIVFLVLKVSDVFSPCGISVSNDKKEASRELAFRRHADIAPLLTPLTVGWEAGVQTIMIHGWASKGTLHDALKTAYTLKEKDSLVLQLLDKMHIFHQHALHKDLSTTNLLVNSTSSGLTLYVNDVGTSVMKSETDDLKIVTTNSTNLAPELIARCAPTHGLFWDHVFPCEITADEWELSERFTIGHIILQIYLGESPYKSLQKDQEIHARHPLTKLPFNVIYADYRMRYQLEGYLSSVDADEIISAYQLAFIEYYNFNLKPRAAPFSESEEGGAKASNKHTEEMKEALFIQHFSDPDLRHQLDPYLGASAAQVVHLWKKAYSRMQKAFNFDYYGDLARIILTTGPLTTAFPDIESLMGGRIKAVLPLLDLDPSKRPALANIAAALRAL